MTRQRRTKSIAQIVATSFKLKYEVYTNCQTDGRPRAAAYVRSLNTACLRLSVARSGLFVVFMNGRPANEPWSNMENVKLSHEPFYLYTNCVRKGYFIRRHLRPSKNHRNECTTNYSLALSLLVQWGRCCLCYHKMFTLGSA